VDEIRDLGLRGVLELHVHEIDVERGDGFGPHDAALVGVLLHSSGRDAGGADAI